MRNFVYATLALTLAVFACSATAAHAGLLSQTSTLLSGTGPLTLSQETLERLAPPCDQAGIAQRFLDWNDQRWYVPGPQGDFEGATDRWELGDGATLVDGGNPLGTEARALELEPNATATSPPVCVGISYTVSRMFAETANPSSDSSLEVRVLYEHAVTGASREKVTELPAVAEWGPTDHWRMPFIHHAGLVRDLIRGNNPEPVEVRFRFTASPESAWTIDDVWVDPRMRR